MPWIMTQTSVPAKGDGPRDLSDYVRRASQVFNMHWERHDYSGATA